MAETDSLTARRKARTVRQIAEAARALFKAQGYEATTIDQIAEEAEVSPRTFFRYFPVKEDLVIALREPGGQRFRDELAGRPADEDLLVSIQAATRASLEAADREDIRWFFRLLAAHPTLQARWREQAWLEQPAFAAAMGRRLGLAPDGLRCGVLTVAVNAAIALAFDRWAASDDDTDPADTVCAALAELSSLLAPSGVAA